MVKRCFGYTFVFISIWFGINANSTSDNPSTEPTGVAGLLDVLSLQSSSLLNSSPLGSNPTEPTVDTIDILNNVNISRTSHTKEISDTELVSEAVLSSTETTTAGQHGLAWTLFNLFQLTHSTAAVDSSEPSSQAPSTPFIRDTDVMLTESSTVHPPQMEDLNISSSQSVIMTESSMYTNNYIFSLFQNILSGTSQSVAPSSQIISSLVENISPEASMPWVQERTTTMHFSSATITTSQDEDLPFIGFTPVLEPSSDSEFYSSTFVFTTPVWSIADLDSAVSTLTPSLQTTSSSESQFEFESLISVDTVLVTNTSTNPETFTAVRTDSITAAPTKLAEGTSNTAEIFTNTTSTTGTTINTKVSGKVDRSVLTESAKTMNSELLDKFVESTLIFHVTDVDNLPESRNLNAVSLTSKWSESAISSMFNVTEELSSRTELHNSELSSSFEAEPSPDSTSRLFSTIGSEDSVRKLVVKSLHDSSVENLYSGAVETLKIETTISSSLSFTDSKLFPTMVPSDLQTHSHGKDSLIKDSRFGSWWTPSVIHTTPVLLGPDTTPALLEHDTRNPVLIESGTSSALLEPGTNSVPLEPDKSPVFIEHDTRNLFLVELDISSALMEPGTSPVLLESHTSQEPFFADTFLVPPTALDHVNTDKRESSKQRSSTWEVHGDATPQNISTTREHHFSEQSSIASSIMTELIHVPSSLTTSTSRSFLESSFSSLQPSPSTVEGIGSTDVFIQSSSGLLYLTSISATSPLPVHQHSDLVLTEDESQKYFHNSTITLSSGLEDYSVTDTMTLQEMSLLSIWSRIYELGKLSKTVPSSLNSTIKLDILPSSAVPTLSANSSFENPQHISKTWLSASSEALSTSSLPPSESASDVAMSFVFNATGTLFDVENNNPSGMDWTSLTKSIDPSSSSVLLHSVQTIFTSPVLKITEPSTLYPTFVFPDILPSLPQSELHLKSSVSVPFSSGSTGEHDSISRLYETSTAFSVSTRDLSDNQSVTNSHLPDPDKLYISSLDSDISGSVTLDQNQIDDVSANYSDTQLEMTISPTIKSEMIITSPSFKSTIFEGFATSTLPVFIDTTSLMPTQVMKSSLLNVTDMSVSLTNQTMLTDNVSDTLPTLLQSRQFNASTLIDVAEILHGTVPIQTASSFISKDFMKTKSDVHTSSISAFTVSKTQSFISHETAILHASDFYPSSEINNSLTGVLQTEPLQPLLRSGEFVMPSSSQENGFTPDLIISTTPDVTLNTTDLDSSFLVTKTWKLSSLVITSDPMVNESLTESNPVVSHTEQTAIVDTVSDNVSLMLETPVLSSAVGSIALNLSSVNQEGFVVITPSRSLNQSSTPAKHSTFISPSKVYPTKENQEILSKTLFTEPEDGSIASSFIVIPPVDLSSVIVSSLSSGTPSGPASSESQTQFMAKSTEEDSSPVLPDVETAKISMIIDSRSVIVTPSFVLTLPSVETSGITALNPTAPSSAHSPTKDMTASYLNFTGVSWQSLIIEDTSSVDISTMFLTTPTVTSIYLTSNVNEESKSIHVITQTTENVDSSLSVVSEMLLDTSDVSLSKVSQMMQDTSDASLSVVSETVLDTSDASLLFVSGTVLDASKPSLSVISETLLDTSNASLSVVSETVFNTLDASLLFVNETVLDTSLSVISDTLLDISQVTNSWITESSIVESSPPLFPMISTVMHTSSPLLPLISKTITITETILTTVSLISVLTETMTVSHLTTVSETIQDLSFISKSTIDTSLISPLISEITESFPVIGETTMETEALSTVIGETIIDSASLSTVLSETTLETMQFPSLISEMTIESLPLSTVFSETIIESASSSLVVNKTSLETDPISSVLGETTGESVPISVGISEMSVESPFISVTAIDSTTIFTGIIAESTSLFTSMAETIVESGLLPSETTVKTAPILSWTSGTTIESAPISSWMIESTVETSPISSWTSESTIESAPISLWMSESTVETSAISSGTSESTIESAPISSWMSESTVETSPISSGTSESTIQSTPISSWMSESTVETSPISSWTSESTIASAPISSWISESTVETSLISSWTSESTIKSAPVSSWVSESSVETSLISWTSESTIQSAPVSSWVSESSVETSLISRSSESTIESAPISSWMSETTIETSPISSGTSESTIEFAPISSLMSETKVETATISSWTSESKIESAPISSLMSETAVETATISSWKSETTIETAPSTAIEVTTMTSEISATASQTSTPSMSSVITDTSPSTTSEVTTVTFKPTLNMSDAFNNLWVVTVIKVPRTEDVGNKEFKNLMEGRLAIAYNLAFIRAQQIQNGTYVPLRRRRRYAMDGDVQLQMIDTERKPSSSSVDLVYYLEKQGDSVPAEIAVSTLALFSDQELAIKLGYVVDTRAKVYLPDQVAVVESPQYWIIGAVLGSIAGAVVLVWCSLCIYFKCCRAPPVKDIEDEGEPHLVGLKDKDLESSHPEANYIQEMIDKARSNGMARQTGPINHSDNVQDPVYAQVRKLKKRPTSSKPRHLGQAEEEDTSVVDETSQYVSDAEEEGSHTQADPPKRKPRRRISPGERKRGSVEEAEELPSEQSTTTSIQYVNMAPVEKPSRTTQNGRLPGLHQTDNDLHEKLELDRWKNKQRQREKRRHSVRDKGHRRHPKPELRERTDVQALTSTSPRSPVAHVQGYVNGAYSESEPEADRHPQETLDQARQRMHQLLDDAFSLVSPVIQANHQNKISPRLRPLEDDLSPQNTQTRPKPVGRPKPQPAERRTSADDELQELKKHFASNQSSFPPKPAPRKSTEKKHTPIIIDPGKRLKEVNKLPWNPYRAGDEAAELALPQEEVIQPKTASSSPFLGRFQTTSLKEKTMISMAGNLGSSETRYPQSELTTKEPQPIIITTRRDAWSDKHYADSPISAKYEFLPKDTSTLTTASKSSAPKITSKYAALIRDLESDSTEDTNLPRSRRESDSQGLSIEMNHFGINSKKSGSQKSEGRDELDIVKDSVGLGVSPEPLIRSIREELMRLSSGSAGKDASSC